ncbi:MAG: type II toxin-antitoxin system PemK/MazF family toxin [Candidatus Gracilibacteria bacterium]|nr:type II toxin-antitoxin system PemK/MazF family toxin [Candidatus Gracilibacteria bacterium]
MFFCFSMTTKGKDNNLFYIKLSNDYFNKNSYIIKSQLKSLDKKRFIKKIGILGNKDFYEIKKELKNFIF